MKEKLSRFGSWLLKEYKGLPKEYKQYIVAGLCIILGAAIPWNVFGSFGSYIQAGLVIGGALLIFKETKKRGKKKKSKKKKKRGKN